MIAMRFMKEKLYLYVSIFLLTLAWSYICQSNSDCIKWDPFAANVSRILCVLTIGGCFFNQLNFTLFFYYVCEMWVSHLLFQLFYSFDISKDSGKKHFFYFPSKNKMTGYTKKNIAGYPFSPSRYNNNKPPSFAYTSHNASSKFLVALFPVWGIILILPTGRRWTIWFK